MEQSLSLSVLGAPFHVVVRMRNLIGKEAPDGDAQVSGNAKRITLIPPLQSAGEAHDTYNFDHVYVPEATSDDLYERTVVNALLTLVDGVNCTIFSFGNTRAGKTYTLEGSSPDAGDGVIPMSISGLFEILGEKMATGNARRRNVRYSYKVSCQYVEVVDEKVRDLLNPQSLELEMAEDTTPGLNVRMLSRRVVNSEAELLQCWRQGQASRTSLQTEFGSLADRSAAIFNIELHQTNEELAEGDKSTHLLSRMYIVDMPGAEALAADPTTLRIREGPTLNQGIMAFAEVCKTLGTKDADFVDYRVSKLTELLQDALGGNCFTVCICNARLGDYGGTKFVLEMAQRFKKIRNFPVPNDGRMVGLTHRQRYRLAQLREQLVQLKAGGEGVPGEAATTHLIQIHELEGRVISGDEERIKVMEDRDAVKERLAELRENYNKLLAQKAETQGQLIQSEEERLKVAKVLVDLQIENTTVLEEAEKSKFELVNKLLAYENDIMELEMSAQAKDDKVSELTEVLERSKTDLEEIKVEYVSLKTNYGNTVNELRNEQTKSQELSVELLNLANGRNALAAQQSSWDAEREQMYRANSELEHRLAERDKELKALEQQLHKLRMEREEMQNRANRAELEREAKILEYEGKKVMADRKLVQFEQGKGEEVMLLKREREELLSEHGDEVKRLSTEIHSLESQFKQASRRAAELESQVREKAEHEARLLSDNDMAQQRLTELSEGYREKLLKYVADVSELSVTASGGRGDDVAVLSQLRGAVDGMFQELVSTYRSGEKESQGELRKWRMLHSKLVLKNRRLYQAYRSLRYQLEDMAPKGALIEVHDEARLQVEDDVTDIERDQEKEMQTLRDKLVRAEAEVTVRSENAVRDAEKHVQQLADANAKFVAQREEVAALQRHVTQLEADKSAQSETLKRLQEELIAQLSDLKTSGLPVHPGKGSGGGGGGDLSREAEVQLQGELSRVRRDLEQARSDAARLQQEMSSRPPQRVEVSGSAGGASGPELAAAKAEVSRLTSENAALRQQISTLQGDLAKAKAAAGSGGGADTKKLEAEIVHLKKIIEADDMREVMREFAETTQAELESERAELQTELTSVQSELDDTKAKLQEVMMRR